MFGSLTLVSYFQFNNIYKKLIIIIQGNTYIHQHSLGRNVYLKSQLQIINDDFLKAEDQAKYI